MEEINNSYERDETMESILKSIKKMLGIVEDYDAFDGVITMHINSVFSTLTQLGIGPNEGFSIYDELETWSDFIGDDTVLEAVKSYTYLRVKLLFDPPMSSTVIESMNRQINELEWRLNLLSDNQSENNPESDKNICISIIKSEINANGELILTYSDNTVVNLGVVVGKDGTNYVLTDTDKTEIANIVINKYDSSVMAILGGESDVTE